MADRAHLAGASLIRYNDYNNAIVLPVSPYARLRTLSRQASPRHKIDPGALREAIPATVLS